MKLTPEIAELAGIFAADGHMNKEYICFWGNIIEDKEYYDINIKGLFKKSFNIDIRPHEKISNSVYGFYVCNKEIIKYFNENLGFNFGSKTYTVKIPKIIKSSKNPKIWASFVRGYFDSDGCLNFDRRSGTCLKIKKVIHTYPRIQATGVSEEMILDLCVLLQKLGIKYNKYTVKSKKENEVDSIKLNILGHNQLKIWMKLIGFSNPSKIMRYNIFKKYGFVPSNTSFEERNKIYNGEMNPLDFYPVLTRSSAWIEH